MNDKEQAAGYYSGMIMGYLQALSDMTNFITNGIERDLTDREILEALAEGARKVADTDFSPKQSDYN